MQMAVVASLTAATAKGDTPASEAQLHKIVEVVRAAGPAAVPTGDGDGGITFSASMIAQRTTHTSVKPSKPWGSASRWLFRPTKRSRGCRRRNTPRSSPTWAGARGHEGATFYSTGSGRKATAHRSSSTPRRMLRNTSARRVSIAGKGAPTTHRNCSRWSQGPSFRGRPRDGG